MLKLFERYVALSKSTLSVLVVAALAAMLILNAAAVITRATGVVSIHWAHEVSLLLALGVYFLSYGIIVRRQAEIRVEFLAKRLPSTVQNVLGIGGDFLQFALYVFIGYLGYKYAVRISGLPMPMTRASQALALVPLVVGFLDASTIIIVRFLLGRHSEAGSAGLSRETV